MPQFQALGMHDNTNIANNNVKTIFLVMLFLVGTMGASLLEGFPDLMAEDLDDDESTFGFYSHNSTSESLLFNTNVNVYGTSGYVPLGIYSHNLIHNSNYTLSVELEQSLSLIHI